MRQDKTNDDVQGALDFPSNVRADVARLLHGLPVGAEGYRRISAVTTASQPRDPAATVLPAAPLGRSLNDGGRPSGEVILCSILQVASPPRVFGTKVRPEAAWLRVAG